MVNGKKNGNTGNNKRSNGNGKAGASKARRARAAGLANGAKYAVPENSVSRRPTGNAQTMRQYGLDAFHPIHVPLPRAVAPYLTVRTVRAFSSADALFLFGPMVTEGDSKGKGWNNTICAAVPNAVMGNALNSNSFNFFTGPIPGDESSGLLECVPASFSVQIMNDSALQSADGVFYCGRMKTNMNNPDPGDTRTIQSLADGLVNYAPPRILTGSKLALGAVQVNALPSDMTDLANFTPIKNMTDVTQTGFTTRTRIFEGFNPIYLTNPGGKTLQFLVGVEWRVRVSPFSPLSSAVTAHKPVPDATWSDIIDTANRVGHGVIDVIDYMKDLL